jgi:hypothetical protein
MTLERTLERLFASATPRRFVLDRGLVLSYDPLAQTFRVGRVRVSPSAAEIAIVRRDAKAAGVVLGAEPAPHEMTAADGRVWKFVQGKLETVRL